LPYNSLGQPLAYTALMQSPMQSCSCFNFLGVMPSLFCRAASNSSLRLPDL
jgi:hypothetical protein